MESESNLTLFGSWTVLIVAVLASVVSFWIFWEETAAKRAAKPEQDRADAVKSLVPDAKDIVDLLKALSTFGDVLIKAGPGLAALIASIFFLSIAAGVVTPKPPPATTTTNSAPNK